MVNWKKLNSNEIKKVDGVVTEIRKIKRMQKFLFFVMLINFLSLCVVFVFGIVGRINEIEWAISVIGLSIYMTLLIIVFNLENNDLNFTLLYNKEYEKYIRNLMEE